MARTSYAGLVAGVAVLFVAGYVVQAGSSTSSERSPVVRTSASNEPNSAILEASWPFVAKGQGWARTVTPEMVHITFAVGDKEVPIKNLKVIDPHGHPHWHYVVGRYQEGTRLMVLVQVNGVPPAEVEADITVNNRRYSRKMSGTSKLTYPTDMN